MLLKAKEHYCQLYLCHMGQFNNNGAIHGHNARVCLEKMDLTQLVTTE